MKKALITGITGQDAAYLAKFLLDKGYDVYGTFRRISTPNFWRLKSMNILSKITLVHMDLTDQGTMIELFNNIKFDEVYNLAAQSFVGGSFDHAVSTSQIDAIGPLMILDTIRQLSPKTKFYQASTSEMYGEVGNNGTQDENTPFHPRSPYASAICSLRCSKLQGSLRIIRLLRNFIQSRISLQRIRICYTKNY